MGGIPLIPSDSGVSIIIQNITLRKQAELCLQENEQQYRQIINTSNEGIWILDKHFKTTYVNNHLAEMFGYQPDEMIGHRVEDFLFPEEWEDHQRRIHNRKIGIKERYDRRFRRKDGSILWVIISATPIFNDGTFFKAHLPCLPISPTGFRQSRRWQKKSSSSVQ
jgi:PAS domain S-box-containing protein